jgi:mRNA interferase RelE/StbE
MTYNLEFLPKALKEWEALDKSVKEQFKKKLAERLENPHNPKYKLSGFDNVYKTSFMRRVIGLHMR